MPRPNKSKKVSRLPQCTSFYAEKFREENHILLNVEEYETVRLIDYLGMTQEACAASMEVGRGTVQSLYTSARGKIARYLVEGGILKIEGGNYALVEEADSSKGSTPEEKGDIVTKIAVPWEDGEVFQHFGRAQCFKLYHVSGEKTIHTEILESGGYSRRMLAELLSNQNVKIVICGGIGAGARNALAERGIRLYAGAAGNADSQVASFLMCGGFA